MKFQQTLFRIVFSPQELPQKNAGFGMSGTDPRKIELRHSILKLTICQGSSFRELLARERRAPFLKGGKLKRTHGTQFLRGRKKQKFQPAPCRILFGDGMDPVPE